MIASLTGRVPNSSAVRYPRSTSRERARFANRGAEGIVGREHFENHGHRPVGDADLIACRLCAPHAQRHPVVAHHRDPPHRRHEDPRGGFCLITCLSRCQEWARGPLLDATSTPCIKKVLQIALTDATARTIITVKATQGARFEPPPHRHGRHLQPHGDLWHSQIIHVRDAFPLSCLQRDQ